jgi:ribosome-binding protein aMBF1 (putative translation factor)
MTRGSSPVTSSAPSTNSKADSEASPADHRSRPGPSQICGAHQEDHLAEDPERVAIREALAFGKAVYDQRCALGLSVADLAGRAGMSADEIECIEEGGTEPTIALLRRLAAALDSDVHLTAGHDLGSVWFEAHAA